MNRIYTRLGDNGTTALLAGDRRPKHEPIFATIGDLDELNAQLGVCLSYSTHATIPKELGLIQRELFTIGAQLASQTDTEYRLAPTTLTRLERWIDTHWSATPPLVRFILPGGTLAGSQLHLARTVARRAERSIVLLGESQPVNLTTTSFLNRLSDYLFAAARAENNLAGQTERAWIYQHD